VAQGFPAVPFVVDTDLTRPDGIIVCTPISDADLVRLGWRVARAIRILLEVPGL